MNGKGLKLQCARRAKEGRFLVSFVLVISLFMVPSCSLFQGKSSPPKVTKWEIPYPSVAPSKADLPYHSVNYDFPLSSANRLKIYVFKSERRLLVVNDGVLIRDYRVGLGPHPNGDKFMQGDGRTPEGEYFVCAKNPSSQFYKSLGLSYPGPKHAEHAFLSGYISKEEYQKILEANEKKNLPPCNTVLGGAIFIHGGGGNEDWTKGCVALFNSAMDEIFDTVSVGTPVEIFP